MSRENTAGRFKIPSSWKDKKVKLVFEGVMTDTAVFVNGDLGRAGPPGGFYEFEYDITSLLKPDTDNLLEVNVSKVSANASVEAAERQADYWVFGGIYRPVYLKAVPLESIDWTAVNACRRRCLQHRCLHKRHFILQCRHGATLR